MTPPSSTPTFDRTAEDLGNIVELGHVNVRVPDQSKAIAFYLMGLGLTRDPVPDGRAGQHVGQRRPRPVPSADARHRCGARHDRAGDAGPGRAAEAAGTAPRNTWKAPNSASARPVTRSKRPAPGATASACMRLTRHVSARCASACRMWSSTSRPAPTSPPSPSSMWRSWARSPALPAMSAAPYAWASTSAESKVIYRETTRADPGIRRPPHPDHAGRFLRPAQETAGAWADQRGKRPAPVPLPRHRRCRHQQAAVPDRA